MVSESKPRPSMMLSSAFWSAAISSTIGASASPYSLPLLLPSIRRASSRPVVEPGVVVLEVDAHELLVRAATYPYWPPHAAPRTLP